MLLFLSIREKKILLGNRDYNLVNIDIRNYLYIYIYLYLKSNTKYFLTRFFFRSYFFFVNYRKTKIHEHRGK